MTAATPIRLGQTRMTPGVAALVAAHPWLREALSIWLQKHVVNDCPHLDDEDRQANTWAIQAGERVLTIWRVPLSSGTETIWVITERDRSSTTVLLPSEY